MTTDFPTGTSRFDRGNNILVVQADGKVVVAGWSDPSFPPTGADFALARYNTDGSLDTTFDEDGRVTTDLSGSNDFASDVAIQDDGMIVVAGFSQNQGTLSDFAIARYNTDGSLDETFGNGGKVITALTDDNDFGTAVAIQSDGKIVVAGQASPSGADFGLVRYNSDGTLDPSFGSQGIVMTDFGAGERPRDMAIQADGKIVVAGRKDGGGTDFILARYNPDGSLDDGTTSDSTHGDSFGTGGAVITDFAGSGDIAQSVVLQDNGTIVVAGSSSHSGTGRDFALARYNVDGSLDDSFGTGGKVTTDFAAMRDEANSLVLQSDGATVKIVAAGFSVQSDTGRDFALARYNADGSLDTDFDSDGRVTTDFAGSLDVAYGVDLQGDGTLVAAGFSRHSETLDDFAVAHYETDGSLDTDFDSDGRVTTDFIDTGSNDDYGESIAVQQSDGKLLLVGDSKESGIGTRPALVRYNIDGSLDSSFGDGGRALPVGLVNFNVRDVAIQADGKIVLAGRAYERSNGGDNFAAARLNADGSLDTDFGSDGLQTIGFGVYGDSALSVAIQADGKIVLGGTAYEGSYGGFSNFAAARLNADGSLDTDFDFDGRQTIDFAGSYDYGSSVAIQADGKIVLGGTAYERSNGGDNFAAARLNADGSLDTGFDSDGRQTIDFGVYGDSALSVAIQADGKIVLGGYASEGSNGGYNFAAARLNADGSLDTDFDFDGRQTIDFAGSYDYGSSVAIQADGKIVLGGTAYERSNGGDNFAAARLNADGSLDTGFDSDGRQTIDFGVYGDSALSVAIQADGKIVLGGYASEGSNGGYNFAAARLNADGSLDTDFDFDGRQTIDFAGGYDYVHSVAIQADGKIVLAGRAYERSNGGWNFAVARLIGHDEVPKVESVEVGGDLQSFRVQLNDDDLDPDSATNPDNYRILAAHGDANGDGDPFNDDDETLVAIDNVNYDPATDRISIHTFDALFADYFRLILDGDGAATDGTPGIVDETGNYLAGGDNISQFDLTSLTLVEDLLAKVEALGLSTGTEHSLTGMLDAVLTQLDVAAGNDQSLSAKLEAFIIGVNHWYEKDEITLDVRDDLIEDADLILLGLSLT